MGSLGTDFWTVIGPYVLLCVKLWSECLGPKWPGVFGPLEWDRMLEFLGSLGQPTHSLRTVKTVQVDGWTKIVHVSCLQNIA